MNKLSIDASKVNWLFVDLNSFFASCEQQERPELRGRPVAIVQMVTDRTCAIAASLEAKKFGIKTGTAIGEARKRCPDLVLVKARHKLYVDYHHRIIKAVDSCVPIEKICSIDEMACRLTGRESGVEAARVLAFKVKAALREQVGHTLTCSIGLAPSLFLGKVGSDMQKPDGLVVITRADLPHILHRLKLTDIYGIGNQMERRLHQAGVYTVEQLMQTPRPLMRRIWGGINGVLYYELLHGADLQFPSSSQSCSISHQHVLEPSLRTPAGAQQFSQHLLAKATERLRHTSYYCKRLGLFLSWSNNLGGWYNQINFHETQNSAFLLTSLNRLWSTAPPYKPIKVGVVLLDLVPATEHQPDLFADHASSPITRSHKLSPVIDAINRRYGRGAVGFGLHDKQVRQFTGHAAFQRVPQPWEF